jgi:hypothetical protein
VDSVVDHGKWLLGNGFRQQIKQNESNMEQEIESQLHVDNHDDVWRATAEVLRAQVSEAVWFSTFNDAVAVADDKMSLRLQVPNTYVRERILTRYMSLVRDALNEVGASDRQLLIPIPLAT